MPRAAVCRKNRRTAGLFAPTLSYCDANGMGASPHDSTAGPAGSRLGADLAAHVEAIVHAAEREARAAEQAIAAHRRSAEEEVDRYLAAARLHVDAETAARNARIETLSAAARRLSDELADAVAALTRELHTDERAAPTQPPRAPWPAPSPTTPAPAAAVHPPAPTPTEPAPPDAPHQPSWTRAASPPPPAFPHPVDAPEDASEPAPDAQEPSVASVEPAVGANGHAADAAVPSAARLVAIEMAVGGSSRAEVEEHLRTELGVGEPEPLLDDVFGVASHAGSRLAWGEP